MQAQREVEEASTADETEESVGPIHVSALVGQVDSFVDLLSLSNFFI